ncbi:MAG: hypothetical protein B6I20_04820 [Bacteroidetes bacterium 4572_117]|nr:MAG: hypothetical protein B6I20_04820 [Bacteroidetes bacterium 4572_117]
MESSLNKQKIEEFLLVANEYCMLIENITEYSKKELLENTQKILSLIYIKTSVLQVPDGEDESYIEKFVKEEDWLFIKNEISEKLGKHESFFEVFTPETNETDNAENISLSEALSDIYQDMKDIVTLYQIGNNESVEGALLDCKINFEMYWGPRLLAVLSVIHNIIYGTENLFDDDIKPNTNKKQDTDNWLINQKFNDFKNEK